MSLPLNSSLVMALGLAISCAFASVALANDVNLPDMGDPSATILTAEEDQRLGQAFMRSIRRQAELIEEPEINAYINNLGYRLLGSADSGRPFTFFVVADPSINAFAGPGGYIGIHSGLILTAESEGELAAVMAHEIAHVTQRHLARAFQKNSTTNMQMMAAIIAAVILGGQVPGVTEAAILASAAGSIQQQLNFTRAHEKEADRVGIDILAEAGFDPKYMPAFFGRLQQSQRFMEGDVPELLRTHPVTPSRIADSENRAAQLSTKRSFTTGNNFELIKARLHTLTNQRQNRIKALEIALNQSSRHAGEAEHYELALWYLTLSDYAKAETHSRWLLQQSPEEELFIALQARIELAKSHDKQAEKRLHTALKLYPQHPLLTKLYVETLLRQNSPQKATAIMREYIHYRGKFTLPSDFQLLAKTEQSAGNSGHAHQALAEYYYFIGYTRTAIEQLETALKHTPEKDNFQLEKIRSRLDQLKRESLEEAEFQAKY